MRWMKPVIEQEEDVDVLHDIETDSRLSISPVLAHQVWK